jgi:hypothetical protein
MMLAPYATARQLGEPRDGLGSDFVNHQVGADAGLDFKWSPTADMAVDATINPDFSQVESDVAVISTRGGLIARHGWAAERAVTTYLPQGGNGGPRSVERHGGSGGL